VIAVAIFKFAGTPITPYFLQKVLILISLRRVAAVESSKTWHLAVESSLDWS